MHTDDELIECKTVLGGKRQITLHSDDWEQLRRNAAVQDKRPVMHLLLGGRPLVVLAEADYLELCDQEQT